VKVALPGRRKSRIEMIPLIDIVFLLLVVFIYAMLSMAVHRGLPVALPASRAAEIEKTLVLSVTMQRDGSVYLDKEPVPLEELTQTLTSRAEGQADPGVLLFADKDVSYQDLFGVLDRIRQAGLHRISLQAEGNE
jgi:biopolymer transport protein ExbD